MDVRAKIKRRGKERRKKNKIDGKLRELIKLGRNLSTLGQLNCLSYSEVGISSKLTYLLFCLAIQ